MEPKKYLLILPLKDKTDFLLERIFSVLQITAIHSPEGKYYLGKQTSLKSSKECHSKVNTKLYSFDFYLLNQLSMLYC